MRKRKEKQCAQWEDRTVDGALYAMGHLRSFDMTVIKEACGNWGKIPGDSTRGL